MPVFVFDTHAGRALVHDAGGEAPLGLDRLGPLLAHLAESGRDAALRTFAADVAAGLLGAAPAAAERLVVAARSGSAQACAEARAALMGAATAAGSVGLRHGAANAAAFLAAFEACAPAAPDAAAGASRMAVLYAEMSGADAAAATRAHIDALLDALAVP